LFHAADRLTGWADWPVTWSAVSNAAAMPLRRILNGRAPVTVVPNGVNPEVWKVSHVARTPGELRLTAVMRLAPRKRPLQLARMLLDVHRRLPSGTRIRVEIIGDGPEQGRLQRFVQRHQMTDWFRLCGRLTRAEIRATFARSDLFVAPAALESFGIAALEARCAGLPILALSGTGVEDFVIHGRDGWLVDSDAAMADTIVGLSASVGTLARVAAHNRHVPPSINWPMVLSGCDALYQSATVQHGLPGRPDPAEAAIRESVSGP
jgi:glycosyltransferase involved in cell wall biosynthesis